MSKKQRKPRSRSRSGEPTSAGRNTLTLAMIVRDEEGFLRECLASARDIVDEIVVVDTGSQDATTAIAREMGATVLHVTWGDDFAAARNHALAAAHGDYVLQLDADERLDPAGTALIRQAVDEGGWDVGILAFIDMDDRGPSGRQWQAPRLYRRVEGIRYVGRIHEQVAFALPHVRQRLIPAAVYHHGYRRSVYFDRQKTDRSLRLLEQALCDPEAENPLLRSNYLYHRAALSQGRELLDSFREFAQFVRGQWGESPPNVPWIVAGLAQQCILLSDACLHSEAKDLAVELMERHGPSPLLRYVLARANTAEGDSASAKEELHRVLQPQPEIAPDHAAYGGDVALIQSRAHFVLGLILDANGCDAEACEHYRVTHQQEPEQELFLGALLCALVRLGNYKEAREALENSLIPGSAGQAPMDCLGLALALLTASAGRIMFWAERVRAAAGSFPSAKHMLERLRQSGLNRKFQLEDFPEILQAVTRKPNLATFRLPQTIRQEQAIRAQSGQEVNVAPKA